ncbi:hypothetical protein [Phytoactinopolyspora limicola]|uniref:hypothetical protein n=1 Tax=Phytoactinopolyspora limicola TaxID=2715536 RepID=UPI001A9C9A60|nr:hypothetical protein [Phytoactinopolyspora limicola]
MITVASGGEPVVVTARLTEPIVDAERHPIMLDGPLAWAAAQLGMAPGPLTPEHAPDMPLPLARWEDGDGVWGWCVSAAIYTPTRHTAVQLRRKPATAAMARYAPDRRHHLALGPHKARDTTLPAVWARYLVWHALTTDINQLADLLKPVTHIGKAHAAGYGRVTTWTVMPADAPDAWMARPLPDRAGILQGVRAPYWHPTRRHPCTWRNP